MSAVNTTSRRRSRKAAPALPSSFVVVVDGTEYTVSDGAIVLSQAERDSLARYAVRRGLELGRFVGSVIMGLNPSVMTAGQRGAFKAFVVGADGEELVKASSAKVGADVEAAELAYGKRLAEMPASCDAADAAAWIARADKSRATRISAAHKSHERRLAQVGTIQTVGNAMALLLADGRPNGIRWELQRSAAELAVADVLTMQPVYATEDASAFVAWFATGYIRDTDKVRGMP